MAIDFFRSLRKPVHTGRRLKGPSVCGIAGIVDFSGDLAGEEARRRCAALCERQLHRGPDDHGVWSEAGIALGHRRLSIIDTTAAGRQPMLSDDGTGVLVFNGEIYNFGALRRSMEAQGERFVSHSDTEVLLKGLHRFGAAFLDQVDGMYAFAYWNRVTRRLLLARDPFGEKPLYLTRIGGTIAFASELAALTVLPGFDDRVAVGTIGLYACLQYVPAPLSIYASCRKLLPGQALQIDAAGEAVLRQWRFVPDGQEDGRPLADLADELEAILVDTVRTRLIADVPLGAFLSGGVDSSLVVALATRVLGHSVRTFSIGFQGSDDSEHEEALAVARRLGADHVEEIVAPDAAVTGLDLGALLDEPNGDSSCLPTWLLSRLARRHVTVALSGDGGDELFGGYTRYFATLNDERRWQAGELPYPEWRPDLGYYSSRLLVMPERDLELLFGAVPEAVAVYLAGRRDALRRDPRPLGDRMRDADAADYLPGAVLAKVDRMSMRHSLEVRAPLLGRDVARFAARLPSRAMFGDATGKLVLKEVAARYLPRDWLDRRKKGFGLPMRRWGEAAVLAAAETLLRPGESRLAEWIGDDALRRFLADQRANPMMYRLWSVVVLERWLRSHPARPDH
jgi:asparagine synthase (glutamine-hydrolysing)